MWGIESEGGKSRGLEEASTAAEAEAEEPLEEAEEEEETAEP
jgi:hypothetical protein